MRHSLRTAPRMVPRVPQDVYAGLLDVLRALPTTTAAEDAEGGLQIVAEGPQGTLCWHASEKAPVLLLAPVALQGDAITVLDRMAGLVTLLPRPLLQQLNQDSTIYVVGCGDTGSTLADLPGDRRQWPALRGAEIRGCSLDSHGQPTDALERLGPVWRCLANATAQWRQRLSDAAVQAAVEPLHFVADALSRRQSTGLGATAWVAAVTTVLAALQMAWSAETAPGLLQLGAGLPLELWGTSTYPYGYISIFSGALLHSGALPALTAAAALAFSQPLESAVGPARWLVIWASAAVAGAALGAAAGTAPGLGAAAGTAAIVMAFLTLARRLRVAPAPWGGLPTRWLWPGLLGALAVTQWVNVSGVGALAVGMAVGAAWGTSGAAVSGLAAASPATEPVNRSSPKWPTWLARCAAALLCTGFICSVSVAWTSFTPWRSISPMGWRTVSLCDSGLTIELPDDLSAPSCSAKGRSVTARVGGSRTNILTLSALVADAPAKLLALSTPAQQLWLQQRVAATTVSSVQVHSTRPLVSPKGATILQDQANPRGPLPRVLSLRCGRLIDIEISIAAGANQAWQAAPARIAASVAADCPGDSTRSAGL